jgi:predicted regulator of Ras-like GTPase activity (Roadblock/LC7/MglB family)
VHQTVIEMDQSFLFVTAAGQGSCLAVLADAKADVGLLAYEMALIVKQVGRHMAVQRKPVPGASEAV